MKFQGNRNKSDVMGIEVNVYYLQSQLFTGNPVLVNEKGDKLYKIGKLMET